MRRQTGAKDPSIEPVGVVLAGGPSTRLGRDKTKLVVDLDHQPLTLIDWAVARLAALCDEVLVAARDETSVDLATESNRRGSVASGVAIAAVADGPGRGPVAGLLGAARARPGRPLLLLACDQPLVPLQALARIAGLDGDAGWGDGGERGEASRLDANEAPSRLTDDLRIPARGDLLEPTCALYGPAAIAALRSRVERGDNALFGLASDAQLRVRRLGARALGLSQAWNDVFLNLNYPADLERFEALAAQTPLRELFKRR